MLVHADVVAEPDHRHDHVVGFYERDSDMVESVTRFLSSAFNDDGAGIVITTEPHRATIEDSARRTAGIPSPS